MSESSVSSPIELTTSYLSRDDWDRLHSCAGRATLAEIHYGLEEPTSKGSAAGAEDLSATRISIDLPQLGSERLVEIWSTGRPVASGVLDDFRFRCDGQVLFGHIEVDLERGDLERATGELYARLLDFAEQAGYPEFLRIWNYVPRINDSSDGLERYRGFCRARAGAFEKRFGDRFVEKLCASSAVGSQGRSLSVAFLASRGAGVHWENPRQVSAYRYPSQYGPRSPSFARATTVPGSSPRALFVSGTASIVGFESRHAGDTVEQCRETLRNIGVIADCALTHPLRSRSTVEASSSLGALSSVKVYLRDPADVETVSRILDAQIAPDVPRLFLEADICRSELTVEIEAVGGDPGGGEGKIEERLRGSVCSSEAGRLADSFELSRR